MTDRKYLRHAKQILKFWNFSATYIHIISRYFERTGKMFCDKNLFPSDFFNLVFFKLLNPKRWNNEVSFSATTNEFWWCISKKQVNFSWTREFINFLSLIHKLVEMDKFLKVWPITPRNAKLVLPIAYFEDILA